jgi:DNA-binding CsgD family transcriptional regulator
MNTDNPNLYISLSDLEALGTAPSIEAFTAVMERVAHGLAMPHFAVIRFGGVYEPRMLQLSHNAPAESLPFFTDFALLGQWSVLQNMREGLRPIVFKSEESDVAGYRAGVAAACVEPRGRTIVVCGRDSPDVPGDLVARQMSMTMLAATHAAACLRVLHLAACPFTDRELECLRYTLAAFSAKETARLLDVSFRTVEEYLARARERFKVSTSVAAAALALDNGWINYENVSRLRAA